MNNFILFLLNSSSNCGKSTRSNIQIYTCPSCEESLNDSSLKFDLSKKLCFMDESATLYHPNILDEASNKLIGLMVYSISIM